MHSATLSSTEETIRALLVDSLEVEPGEIRPDADMVELLPDSLMRVDLAVQLQEQLGVRVDDQIKSLTYLDFVAYVDGLRRA